MTKNCAADSTVERLEITLIAASQLYVDLRALQAATPVRSSQWRETEKLIAELDLWYRFGRKHLHRWTEP